VTRSLLRNKDGRRWRIGRRAEIAWIEENTESGLTIMSAILPVFEAYATLEEPGTGNHELTAYSVEDWKRHEAEWERHEAGVLDVLTACKRASDAGAERMTGPATPIAEQ
jgi:hypothetical protein